MINKEKYDQAFIETFGIEAASLTEELAYQSVTAWDSVGHMALVATLEDAFDIMLETEDIIDFSSYVVGMKILAKYNVVI